MSLRIAVVAPGGASIGGQAVQARTLCSLLRADGWDATLVPIDPRFPRGARWLRALPGARTLVNEAIYLPRLRALRGADVVHVFSASWWSFFLAAAPALAAARRYGRRVVLNYHSGEAEDHLRRWGDLVAPWLALADAIVVPSRYLGDVFARHGYAARVVPNVVDTGTFRFRDRQPLRPNLLSTRNLERHYRVDVTLRAFALIRRRHSGATLTIAGTGREEPKLQRLAAEIGDAGVRFTGAVPPPRVPALYDAADVYVNSSIVDNQPVSILEALASGTPVISTATGDIGALVRDGVTGVTIPPGDPAAMAGAVDRLLADPDASRRLARRARAEVERHTWSRVKELWREIYTGGAA